MNRLHVSLRVALKGADPVISTAYLTLVEKMGYHGKLLALNRLDSYAFSIACPDPASTAGELSRSLAVQSTFYNRNKHNYFLEYRWDGHRRSEGADAAGLDTLSRQMAQWSKLDKPQDLDGQPARNGFILGDAIVYRTEVLVEDIDADAKVSLGRTLEADLADAQVSVTERGTRWYLALRVGSEADARAVTREIAVTESRGRGLLLNPNHQQYKLLSLCQIDL